MEEVGGREGKEQLIGARGREGREWEEEKRRRRKMRGRKSDG